MTAQQTPAPANSAQRTWVSGGAQPKANSRALRQAAKEREHQRRADEWTRIRVAWQVRFIASRPGPDRQAAKALCAPLSYARTVNAVRVQLMAEGDADGRLAFLDRIVAQVVADTEK